MKQGFVLTQSALREEKKMMKTMNGTATIFTTQQENDFRFLVEKSSEMMGGIDSLINLAIDDLSEVDSHSSLQIADELKAAREHLLKARRLSRNVINGQYEKLVDSIAA